ncbi:hypothetical protein BDZ89DRAFT_1073685 [Hymenopellis radicata]|nr:hypothetical protein BDZ89DRAFT_1073685 [Hymenopellis radicata]
MANAILRMVVVLLASLASMPIGATNYDCEAAASTGKEPCLMRRYEDNDGPPWEKQNPSPEGEGLSKRLTSFGYPLDLRA